VGDVIHVVEPIGQARLAESRVCRHDDPARFRERRNEWLPLVEAAAAVQKQDRARFAGPLVGIDMIGIDMIGIDMIGIDMTGIEHIKVYIRDLQHGRLHARSSRGGGT
jgi:hypothetical protein